MSPSPRLALVGLAALAAALLFFQLGSLGLTEPSEGRYADIGRAMADSGDWITPRLNGIPHFEKPPFAYWMVALGVRAFGPTEFAVRCPAALFGVGIVLLAFGIGLRLWDARTGFLAGAFLLASPEFFGVARSITTDVFVTFWSTAAAACFVRAYAGAGAPLRPGWRWAYWGCLGMGMLAKGPVALAAGFLPVLAFLVLRREWTVLRGLAPGRGLLLSAAFLVPWVALLERENPGVLRFLVFQRSASAFVSAEEFKGEPFWFFLPVVLFGCIPCTPALGGFFAAFPASASGPGADTAWGRVRARIAAVLRDRETSDAADRWAPVFLVVWAGTILFFFSLSASKLLTYILPITPPLALAAARAWTAGTKADPASGCARALRAGSYALLALYALCAVGVPIGLHLDPLPGWKPNLDPPRSLAGARPLGYALAAALAAFAAGGAILLRRNRLRAYLGAQLAFQVLALALALAVWKSIEAEFNTLAPLARALAREARPGDAIVAWKSFPRSLGFYLGRPTPTIDYDKRDVRLVQDRPETRELLRFGRAEMLRHFDGARRAFIVTRYRYFWNDDELRARTRMILSSGGMVVIVPKTQE